MPPPSNNNSRTGNSTGTGSGVVQQQVNTVTWVLDGEAEKDTSQDLVENQQCYYHKTQQPATRVMDCCTGHFIGNGRQYVIASHGSRLVLYGVRSATDGSTGLGTAGSPSFPLKSSHIDPVLMGFAGSAAVTPSDTSSGVFQAIQTIPVNGTALFVRPVASLVTGSSVVQQRHQKDYLFVYFERGIALLLDLARFHAEQPDYPAEFQKVVEIHTVGKWKTNSGLDNYLIRHAYTTEQCTVHAEARVAALHVYARVLTVIRLGPALQRYHSSSGPSVVVSPDGFDLLLAANVQHHRMDLDFVHKICFGTVVGPPSSSSTAAATAAATASTASPALPPAADSTTGALPAIPMPTLYLLHDERKNRKRRHVSAITGFSSDYLTSAIIQSDVEGTASALMPLHNGVCVLGETFLCFVNGVDSPKTIRIPQSMGLNSPPWCVAPVDHWRFVVGYAQNTLCLASVLPPPSFSKAQPLPVQFAASGRTPPPLDIHIVSNEVPSPASLCYMDGGYCFAGSAYGDSVLVNMLHGGFESVVPSLGPVTCLKSAVCNGKMMTFASCGGQREGGLCQLKLCVEVDAIAELSDVGPTQAIFGVGDRLVLSYPHYSKVLAFNENGEMEEETDGLPTNVSTLLCAKVVDEGEEDSGCLVHVVSHQLSLVAIRGTGEHAASTTVLQQVPLKDEPTHCDYNTVTNTLMLAFGRTVACYAVSSTAISEPVLRRLPSEVACASLSDRGELILGLWSTKSILRFDQAMMDTNPVATADNNTGTGTNSVAAVEFAGGEELVELPSLPRSVQLLTLNPLAPRALVVGLSDGAICFSTERLPPRPSTASATHLLGASPPNLTTAAADSLAGDEEGTGDETPAPEVKRFSHVTTMELGTQPVHLTRVEGDAETYVVATGDSPALVHMPHRTVHVTAMIYDTLACITPFGPAGQLALVGEGNLILGTLGNIRKLSKKRLLEGGSVDNVVHFPPTNHLVASVHLPSRDEVVLFQLPDFNREEKKLVLAEQERATAIVSTVLGSDGDPNGSPFEAIVVAITFAMAEEREPQFSRLAVFVVGGASSPQVPSATAAGAVGASGSSGHPSPKLEPAGTAKGGHQHALVAVGHQREVQGGVFAACSGSNGKLLVGVMNQIEVFGWSFSDSSLVSESSVRFGLLPLVMRRTNENLYVIGDYNYGVGLLQFNDMEHIAVVGRDLKQRSIMDVAASQTDAFFSDENGNVYSVWHRVFEDIRAAAGGEEGDRGAEGEDDAMLEDDEAPGMENTGTSASNSSPLRGSGRGSQRHRGGAAGHDQYTGDSRARSTAAQITEMVRRPIETRACWHHGDKIVSMLPGTLSYMEHSHSRPLGANRGDQEAEGSLTPIERERQQPYIYGTTNGALGSFYPIGHGAYRILTLLTKALEEASVSVGTMPWGAYRRIQGWQVEESQSARGIIDGDLIETFLALPSRQAKELVLKNFVRLWKAMEVHYASWSSPPGEPAESTAVTAARVEYHKNVVSPAMRRLLYSYLTPEEKLLVTKGSSSSAGTTDEESLEQYVSLDAIEMLLGDLQRLV